tara:strand:+ start:753 stop:1319 length:567 start_codon:yes stop_codon:yes gene_type:complete
MANPFEQIRARDGDQDKSFKWYMNQVKKIRGEFTAPGQVFNSDLGETVADIKIGSMYMFQYDALHKDTLPYYDAFPLVLPYESTPNGFYGLNLHYLPYMMRAQLLGSLIETVKAKTIGPKTRMRYNWALLSQASRAPQVKPCVKRYIAGRTGKLFKVNPQDWKSAIFLPVEQFNTSKQKVYSDSRRMA